MGISGRRHGECAGPEEGIDPVGGGKTGGSFGRDGVVGETVGEGKKVLGPSSTSFACLFGKGISMPCKGRSFCWAPTSSICFPWDTFSSAFRPCCFKLSSRLRRLSSRSCRLFSFARSSWFRCRILLLSSISRLINSASFARLCAARARSCAFRSSSRFRAFAWRASTVKYMALSSSGHCGSVHRSS